MRSATKYLNFTKSAIEQLKPPATGRKYIYDTKKTGLALCITAAGAKVFYHYRKFEGKPERYRIGAWPEFTVEQAREDADRQNGKHADGQNPSDARRTLRNAPTFKEIFDDFIELPTRTKAKRPKAKHTVHNYRLQFNNYLKDWHSRKISTVKREEIEKFHNHLAKTVGNHTANRVLALVKVLYSTAIDLKLYNQNPASRIMPFEEQARERFLQPDELPNFWKAVEDEPSEKIRDFVKVALFTGQRRSNVAAMKWEDINLERATWVIPQTKSGRHEVPLLPEVIEILKRRRKDNPEGAHVFPGRHGHGYLVDPMRQWKEILARAGVSNLRIHDLRRSLGSWQTITGASLSIVGKTLGHKTSEATAVYARLHDDPVRSAMSTAAAAILAATQSKGRKGDE